MGDPHSPGMAIGACAWMEMEWIETISKHTKQFFRAKRYMDDILLFYNINKLDGNFIKDFTQSECYLPPLRLEESQNQNFLETSIKITSDNKIQFWLKNYNAVGEAPKIWRYMHFNSYASFPKKRPF